MKISILPKHNKIVIDGVEAKVDCSFIENIDVAFFDDTKGYGKIQFQDGKPNERIKVLPQQKQILEAYWNAYSKKTPSKYHTWDKTKKEFYISPVNQQLKVQDEADQQSTIEDAIIKNNLKNEELSKNPLTGIKDIDTWVDTQPTKEILKHIIKFIKIKEI